MSPVLLALETATEACSAALLYEGRVLRRHAVEPRGHARLLPRFVDELLAEAGLARSAVDAIAAGRGPGAFTGVRIAVAFAQGLALALERPTIAVSTLAVLAQGAVHRYPEVGGAILAAIDARMGQVYWGVFENRAGLVRPLGAEAVLDPAAVTAEGPVPAGMAVGTGWAAHGEALRQALGEAPARVLPEALPDAADLLRLAEDCWARGETRPPERLQPVYLRDNVARKPQPR